MAEVPVADLPGDLCHWQFRMIQQQGAGLLEPQALDVALGWLPDLGGEELSEAGRLQSIAPGHVGDIMLAGAVFMDLMQTGLDTWVQRG